jgi:hypothetical protein
MGRDGQPRGRRERDNQEKREDAPPSPGRSAWRVDDGDGEGSGGAQDARG